MFFYFYEIMSIILKLNNYFLFMKRQETKGFTLVELIVVITILAILWTIAFLTLQDFNKDARDWQRVSDIQSFRKWIELYATETGEYPMPDNVDNSVIVATNPANYPWVIGELSSKNARISKELTDPLTWENYKYSLEGDKDSYEITYSIESHSFVWVFKNAYANNFVDTKIVWNFNWIFARTSNGKVVTMPSLFSKTASAWDIVVWTPVEFVVPGKPEPVTFTPNEVTFGNTQELIENIQTEYATADSSITNLEKVKKVVELDPTSSESQETFEVEFLEKTPDTNDSGPATYSTTVLDSNIYGSDDHIIFNNVLYFEAERYSDYVMYKYDWNNVSLADPSSSVTRFSYPIIFNNELYFGGRSSWGNYGMYKYDWSSISLADTNYSGNFSIPIIFNNELYFQWHDWTNRRMYKYDWSSVSLADPSSSVTDFKRSIIFNNIIYFLGRDWTTRRMYKYDWSSISLADLSYSFTGFNNPIIFNNNLYFKGEDSWGTSRMYKYDWNAFSLADSGSSVTSFYNHIIFNDNLYFRGEDSWGTSRMYKYDWNAISLADTSSSITRFERPIIVNAILYFEGYDWTDYKIYKYDWNSISLADPSSSVTRFWSSTIFNNELFFRGTDSWGTYRIYKYDWKNISLFSEDSLFSSSLEYNWELITAFSSWLVKITAD